MYCSSNLLYVHMLNINAPFETGDEYVDQKGKTFPGGRPWEGRILQCLIIAAS